MTNIERHHQKYSNNQKTNNEAKKRHEEKGKLTGKKTEVTYANW